MGPYFDSFNRIADLKRAGKFDDAFNVAVQGCMNIPLNHSYFGNPGPPCYFLAEYAIAYQQYEPLDRFIRYARSKSFHTFPDEYGPSWDAFLSWAQRSYALFGRALQILEQQGSAKQTDLYRLVGTEGRELSQVFYWADRFGAIKRQKQGRTYLVSLPERL